MHAQRAVYLGTFDPVTHGHLDVIRRARAIFDQVLVAVAANPEKRPLFDLEERVAFIRRATRGWRGVSVESFDGLAVEYVRRKRASVMLRGIRMISDFEQEFQLALTNRKLDGGVETIFLMPSESYAYLSSRLLKEAAGLGADMTPFVPRFIARALRERLRG
jgi:pantetheine-phosphate adenylyltransferase